MKKMLFKLLVISILFLVYGFSINTNEISSKNGIQFYKGSFNAAIDKSYKEDKYAFVYVYAKWCAVCKKLKKNSFKNKEVGDYYNKNFINISIDGETEEGKKLINKYGITSYPTLLIVDYNENLKTKQVGFLKPYILINFGKRIVP